MSGGAAAVRLATMITVLIWIALSHLIVAAAVGGATEIGKRRKARKAAQAANITKGE